MSRRLVYSLLIAGLFITGGLLPSAPVCAQGTPDAWTTIELNMRSGPDAAFSVLVMLPVDTPLIIEAHDEAQDWLLAHTMDGGARGWVASIYLRYQEGFAAFRLPVSSEEVTTPANLPVESAPVANAAPSESTPVEGETIAPPSGMIETMVPLYSTANSEYFAITYLSDGLRIKGFLGWPTGSGPYAAVIFNRGGVWDSGMLNGTEIVPFVESGYVAIASQYRGCAGSEGLDQFGGDDLNDVLNLIPILDSLPKVDPSRIGMMGRSRGGMMTYLALQADALSGAHRIRAAVTVGGLADLFIWPEENQAMTDTVYMSVIGAMPDRKPDPYIQRSAVYWAQNIDAPLLLLHGGADPIVWARQSENLYKVLQQYGKIAGLIVYPGEQHEINGQYNGYPEALRYLGGYLGGDTNNPWDTHRTAIDDAMRWFWEHPMG